MRKIINKILIQNHKSSKNILPKNNNPKYNFKDNINPLFANISSVKVIITIDVINGYTLSRQVFSISFFFLFFSKIPKRAETSKLNFSRMRPRSRLCDLNELKAARIDRWTVERRRETDTRTYVRLEGER